MNLLLLQAGEVQGNRVRVDGRRARHLLDIVHVKPGDSIRAGVLNGLKGQAVVEHIHAGAVELRCNFFEQAPSPKVDLILALPRPKVLKRLLPSLASLQVGHIALTNAWRVERNYFDTHVLRPQVYESLLMEGLEQGAHTSMPSVSIHKRLVQLVEEELRGLFGQAGSRLLAHPGADESISKNLLDIRPQRVLVAVGPEGGWIDRELQLFERSGFLQVRLGNSVLRTDVACHVLLGLVNELLE